MADAHIGRPHLREGSTYTHDKDLSNLAVFHVVWTDSGLQLMQKVQLELIQTLQIGEYGLHRLIVKQLRVQPTFLQETLRVMDQLTPGRLNF